MNWVDAALDDSWRRFEHPEYYRAVQIITGEPSWANYSVPQWEPPLPPYCLSGMLGGRGSGWAATRKGRW